MEEATTSDDDDVVQRSAPAVGCDCSMPVFCGGGGGGGANETVGVRFCHIRTCSCIAQMCKSLDMYLDTYDLDIVPILRPLRPLPPFQCPLPHVYFSLQFIHKRNRSTITLAREQQHHLIKPRTTPHCQTDKPSNDVGNAIYSMTATSRFNDMLGRGRCTHPLK